MIVREWLVLTDGLATVRRLRGSRGGGTREGRHMGWHVQGLTFGGGSVTGVGMFTGVVCACVRGVSPLPTPRPGGYRSCRHVQQEEPTHEDRWNGGPRPGDTRGPGDVAGAGRPRTGSRTNSRDCRGRGRPARVEEEDRGDDRDPGQRGDGRGDAAGRQADPRRARSGRARTSPKSLDWVGFTGLDGRGTARDPGDLRAGGQRLPRLHGGPEQPPPLRRSRRARGCSPTW